MVAVSLVITVCHCGCSCGCGLRHPPICVYIASVIPEGAFLSLGGFLAASVVALGYVCGCPGCGCAGFVVACGCGCCRRGCGSLVVVVALVVVGVEVGTLA